MVQIGRRRPIPEHTRLDGRRVYPASVLDFRGAERPDYRLSQKALLSGGLIGLTVPYHYTANGGGERQQQMTAFGYYTGDTQALSFPLYTWHPHDSWEPVQAPVFEFFVAADRYRRVSVGKIAVACLRENERAKAMAEDHAAIQEVLGVHAIPSEKVSYLGKVAAGSLFYTTPPDPDIATHNGLVIPPLLTDTEQMLAFSFAPPARGSYRA